ncbi:MAG: thiamine phosphate synthase [Alphaproteobacteria bacterium]|nr:thiamine phosphate synthase [Alphaproteobacteria bacterium]
MTKKCFDLSVYFIADPHVCGDRPVEDVVKAAVEGGATMVQLRNKEDDLDIIEKQALNIKKVLSGTNIPFLINDYVDLANELDLDGVHIGQGDMEPEQARRIIGKDKILGLTAYTEKHFEKIDPKIVDYAGTGPFYATLTKPGKAVLGPEKFSDLIECTTVPVVGIGGITPENADKVIECGAHGVAMMRSVSESDNPASVVREFVRVIRKAQEGLDA